MEDMMKALLDVVRAQHTATEGSEERPFDINDIIYASAHDFDTCLKMVF